MKQMFKSSRIIRVTSVLGLAGLLGGLVSITPARADDDWRFHRWNDHAQKWDRDAIRRDENRLHDLYNQRRTAQRNHNWDRVHTLDRRISDVRNRLDHDSYGLRRDRRL